MGLSHNHTHIKKTAALCFVQSVLSERFCKRAQNHCVLGLEVVEGAIMLLFF
jgi:hypothetical protein